MVSRQACRSQITLEATGCTCFLQEKATPSLKMAYLPSSSRIRPYSSAPAFRACRRPSYMVIAWDRCEAAWSLEGTAWELALPKIRIYGSAPWSAGSWGLVLHRARKPVKTRMLGFWQGHTFLRVKEL